MKTLLIDAKREGYALDQCGRTMTVGELMDWLDQFDDDCQVYLSHDNGYTYGTVTEYDFTEWNEPEEEEMPNDPLDPEAAKTAVPMDTAAWFSDEAKSVLAYLDGSAFLYQYKGRLVLTDESLQLTETDGSNGTPVGGPRWTGDSLRDLNKWLEDCYNEEH